MGDDPCERLDLTIDRVPGTEHRTEHPLDHRVHRLHDRSHLIREREVGAFGSQELPHVPSEMTGHMLRGNRRPTFARRQEPDAQLLPDREMDPLAVVALVRNQDTDGTSVQLPDHLGHERDVMPVAGRHVRGKDDLVLGVRDYADLGEDTDRRSLSEIVHPPLEMDRSPAIRQACAVNGGYAALDGQCLEDPDHAFQVLAVDGA